MYLYTTTNDKYVPIYFYFLYHKYNVEERLSYSSNKKLLPEIKIIENHGKFCVNYSQILEH